MHILIKKVWRIIVCYINVCLCLKLEHLHFGIFFLAILCNFRLESNFNWILIIKSQRKKQLNGRTNGGDCAGTITDHGVNNPQAKAFRPGKSFYSISVAYVNTEVFLNFVFFVQFRWKCVNICTIH